VLLSVLTVCLVMPGAALAGGGPKSAMKLEGAWIAKVPTTQAQWSYVLSPDASGRHATGHGTVEVGFAAGEFDAEYTSPLLIEVTVTGPDTAAFNSVWYGLKKSADPAYTAEIVYIAVNQGTIRSVGPGKAEGLHNIAYYLPTQDADGDGLPDPGQTPVAPPIQVPTFETRVPAPF
jgi:hypothetical protein